MGFYAVANATGFKASETLLGIETLLAMILHRLRSLQASKPLKPF